MMNRRIRKKHKQLAYRDQVIMFKLDNTYLSRLQKHTQGKLNDLKEDLNHCITANCELQNEILAKNKQIAELKEANNKLQNRLQSQYKAASTPTSSIQRITGKIKEFVSGK